MPDSDHCVITMYTNGDFDKGTIPKKWPVMIR